SGASWFPLNDFMANLGVACMVMDPINADVIYAGTGDGFHEITTVRGAGIFKTSDGGATWSQLSATTNTSFHYVDRLAIDPNNGGEVYRSTDGGHSYQRRNTGTKYLGGQGWFCNAIWADPTSTHILIVGGFNLWRSTDGGATLTRISQWFLQPTSPHADQHVIVSGPAFDGTSVKTVYFGNDGGIYRAADVYTVSEASGWEDLNHNLG